MLEERIDNAMEYKRLYFNVNPKMTQNTATLQYMEVYGSITPIEAFYGFNCMRLGARVSDLRKMGYAIKTIRAKGDKPYAIYSLVGGEADDTEEYL